MLLKLIFIIIHNPFSNSSFENNTLKNNNSSLFSENKKILFYNKQNKKLVHFDNIKSIKII